MRISRTQLCVFVLGYAALAAACGGTEPPATNTGGAPTDTGGTSTGTGGATPGSGGTSVASGGQSASGGSVSGGSASGGAESLTGGSNSGGTATGGTASGGKATGGGGTGGASSGGQSATGGSGGAAAGCGLSGAATGVQNLQITVGGQTRTYVLSVPTSYSSSTALPLVFGFHGMGGSGTLARQYFRVEQAAGSQAIFVYPDGLANDGGSTSWNFTTTSADMAFFDALLAQLKSSYCIDANRIFVTGHSAGAMATNALGCYRGDVIRAIAPVAGMPPRSYGSGTVTCAGNVGAWIAHGENDTTVDYTTGGIATRDFWIARNGCSTNTVPDSTVPACVVYQNCSPDLPVVWCVHTQGHNWPSGTNCDGGVCFNAGPAIWAFFASFQ
jgi:poly(3-hydroxybutyrate) depolymerase